MLSFLWLFSLFLTLLSNDKHSGHHSPAHREGKKNVIPAAQHYNLNAANYTEAERSGRGQTARWKIHAEEEDGVINIRKEAERISRGEIRRL